MKSKTNFTHNDNNPPKKPLLKNEMTSKDKTISIHKYLSLNKF